MILLRACVGFIGLCVMVGAGWAADEPEAVSNPTMKVLDLIFKV